MNWLEDRRVHFLAFCVAAGIIGGLFVASMR